jgi:hypothetical protein
MHASRNYKILSALRLVIKKESVNHGPLPKVCARAAPFLSSNINI